MMARWGAQAAEQPLWQGRGQSRLLDHSTLALRSVSSQCVARSCSAAEGGRPRACSVVFQLQALV